MRGYLLWLPLLLSPLAQAMQALDDVSLSGITGQDGITLETTGGGWGGSNTKVNYTQDGQTLSLEGVSNKPQSSTAVSTSKFDVVGDQLQIEHKPAAAQLKVESIRMNGSGASFGSLNAFYTLGATLLVKGANPGSAGLRITPNVTLSSSLLQYQDQDQSGLQAGSFVGTLSSTKGLTLDVATDGSGQYANIAFEDLTLTAALGGLTMGNPLAIPALTMGNSLAIAAKDKLGGLAFGLNFLDEGTTKTNRVQLRGGGDANAGTQGVTGQLSWNLVSPRKANGDTDPLQASFVRLTDNDNNIYLSGLRSNGSGQFTLDLCATGCYGGTGGNLKNADNLTYNPGYNGYFPGVRFGLNNVIGSYSIDGLRVGKKGGAFDGGQSAPLQGGTELLVLMEVFPAYEFTINAGSHLTIKPGGFVTGANTDGVAYNADGVGFNADFDIKDAKAALTVDENGKGLWLAGMTYDMHYRDGSLDVTTAGIELRKGTYWSKLDVSDVRWGNRTTGASLGRIVLKRYEIGSMLTISSGGAGDLCIGGSGATSAICTGDGGRWEPRGDEGLTVKLKNVFAKDADAINNPGDLGKDEQHRVLTKVQRNQLIVETNRGVGGNGSGSQLVLDNFYTSDGNPNDSTLNTYGFNADLNVDVAPTVVKNKTTSVETTPLGFAVNGRIHFKEFNVERLQNVHPTSGVGGVPGAVTAMYGIKAQNANIGVNLTATPIN